MYYEYLESLSEAIYIASIAFFTLCLLDKASRLTSFTILLSNVACTIAIFTVDPFDYIDELVLSIELDGVTAIAIIALLCKERIAVKQASLLGFAVLCHTMILYDLTVTSSALTNFFYEFYDEMIIIVSILQMVVARDGVFTAIGRIQGFVYGFWLRHIHLSKGLCIYSSGKAEK